MNKDHIVGLDIGGTKCAFTLAKRSESETPRIISKVRFDTPKSAPYQVLERFMSELDSALAAEGLEYDDVYAIGISCGGPLDSRRGIVMSPPNLPGWDNIEVSSYFEKKTGIRCKLQNDANASAVAEWKYGAGAGLESMAFLTFGTGLGAGLILDGRLYSGRSDNAGEIGHVRLSDDGPLGYGKHGSCEGFCSGGGIAKLGAAAMLEAGEESRLYKAVGGDVSKITAKLLAELADDGDEVSVGVYELCAEKLGRTIAMLSDILDVERVVIGGIYMRAAHLLRDRMLEVLRAEALNPCEVAAAVLGENIGDYAALSVAEI